MKRVITYFIYALLLFPFEGNAQTAGLISSQLTQKSNRLQGKITGEAYYINSLENNFYFLQRDWIIGNVLLEDGNMAEGIKMRYNAYDDELTAYNIANKALFIIDKQIVKEFHFVENNGKRTFVKIYQDGIFPGYRYFEKLYQSENALLAFHTIKEVKVSPYNDHQGILRDTEYRPDITYYYYSAEKGLLKLNFRRKSFFNIAPERKKEIRKSFRKNKIFISDESSLLQAFIVLDKEGQLD